MSAETFRLVTILVTLVAGLVFPWAIYFRVPTTAAGLVVAILVINFFGASIALADVPTEDVFDWYRAPRILLASILALLYSWIAFRSARRRRRILDSAEPEPRRLT